MSDLWYIYKDGQALGPMTPAEIRTSLRDGSIDPFDLVSRDGSSVRRELVEVDEIFFNSKIVYAEAPAQLPAAAGGGGGGKGAGARESTQVSQSPMSLSGELPLNAGQHLQLAERRGALAATQVSGQEGQRPRRKQRRDPKRYYLMDGRGRVLGPVSAGDVQSMYYKGVLDRGVKVMKDGSAAQVPVAKFVSIYSEQAKPRSMPAQAAHPAMPVMAGPPRMAMGLGPGLMSGPLARVIAIAGMVAALVIASLTVWMLYRGGSFDWLARKPYTPVSERKVKQKPAKVKPKPSRGVLSRPDGKASIYERAAPKRRGTPKAEPKLSARQRQFQEFRKARAQAERIRLEKKKKATLAKQEKVALAAKPAPYVPKPPAVIKPAPPAAPPAPAGLLGTPVGQMVNGAGPLNFNKNAVQSCDGGCTVMFSGAPGSIRVKFFKEVWGPALLSKGGGVKISGLMREDSGGKFILLSDVQ